MTVVALSGSYGAGGSRIGPLLAERLEIPFLDRAIPSGVAGDLEVAMDEAVSPDQQQSGSWIERMLTGFAGLDNGGPSPLPADTVTSDDFRHATERILREQAATGDGVILGRAAVLVLRDEPAVIRVRLDGPAPRRVRQAMELVGISHETAERRRRQVDHAHTVYAEHFYGARLTDPGLYHVMLDSTALELDACAEMIELAVRSVRERADQDQPR